MISTGLLVCWGASLEVAGCFVTQLGNSLIVFINEESFPSSAIS